MKKAPAGKLAQRVCDECERDILVGSSAGTPVRLEPDLTTQAAEPVMWRLGVPTYAVRRDAGVISLVLRIPTATPEPWDEIAIAHMCGVGEYQTQQVIACPQWFGHQKYVVALINRNYLVLRADEHGQEYREVFTCSSQEEAHRRAYVLGWRDRARLLR